MNGDKKRQHYVWKKYLKPWTEDSKIWCRRKASLFNTALENVAQERYFYYAEPLNQVEYGIVLSLISRTHPSAHATLLNDLNYYRAASESTEHEKRNALEDYHDKIEHSIGDSLDRLYQRDRSFLKDEEKRAHFGYFVGLQQLRTKKSMRSSTAAIASAPVPETLAGKYDPEKLGNVISLIFADITGNWIQSKAKVYFMDCGEKSEFITSDQSLFNFHKGVDSGIEPPEELELFYPITPKLALWISGKEGCDRTISETQLMDLNLRIIEESYEQVFAKDHETLLNLDQAPTG